MTSTSNRSREETGKRGLLRTLASSLFSFEFLFVAFLFAGRFKGDPRFAWIRFDATVLLWAASIIVGAVVLLRRRARQYQVSWRLILPGVLFLAWAVASLLWAPQGQYSEQKALRVGGLVAWSFLGASFVIAPDLTRLRRFYLLTFLFSSWMAIEALVAYLKTGGPGVFIEVMGGNYLGLGRVVGLGALIALGAMHYEDPRPVPRFLLYLAWFVFLLVLTVAGGRGPLIATLVGALGFLAWQRMPHSREGPKLKASTAIAGLSVPAVGLMVTIRQGLRGMSVPTTVGRLLLMVAGVDASASVSLRLFWIRAAIDLWLEGPIIGLGIGGWASRLANPSLRAYPHNIILEVLSELGTVGLLLFLWMIAAALSAVRKKGGVVLEGARVLALMLFLNSFANALVSGDIPDNRVLFAIIGMMGMLPKLNGSGLPDARPVPRGAPSRSAPLPGHGIDRYSQARYLPACHELLGL